MNVVEELIARFTGDATGYIAAAQGVIRQSEAAAASVQGLIRQVEAVGRSAANSLASVGVALSGVGLLRNTVGLAATAETTTAAFETMLGSATRAQEMVASLQRYADVTPYRMPGVSAAAEQLLTLNVSAENVLPMIRAIGDVAQGSDERLQHLAHAFGLVVQEGRLMGHTEMMMTRGGMFSPLQEIARTSGQDITVVREAMHRGEISVQQVADAFRTATTESGRFSGSSARHAQTLTGLWSTMADNVAGVARTVGQDIVEQLRLKDLVRGFSAAAESAKAFVQGLGPDFKLFAAAVGAAAIGTVALSAAFYLLRSYGGALFNPFALGISAVAVGIGVLVARAGGLGEAWAQVSGVLTETWGAVKQALAPVVSLVGDFAAGFGLVALSAVTMAGQIGEALGDVLGGIGDFIARNREMVVIAGGVTAVVVLAALAFKAFSVAAALAMAVLSATGVVQVINTGVWVIWTAAVVTAKLGMLAFTAVVLLAKGAMWLLNAAVAAFGILALPVLMIGAAAAFAVVGAAVGVVVATITAAGAAAGALLTFLREIPTTSGPIAVIAGLFAEWRGILADVWSGLSTNSGKAMELLSAGFGLAVEQIKQVAGPLWDFVKSGASAAAAFVGATFSAHFQASIDRMVLSFKVGQAQMSPGLLMPDVAAETKAIDEALKQATTTATATGRAAMQGALQGFDAAAGGTNPAIQAAREQVRAAREALAAAVAAGPATAEEPEWLRRIRAMFDGLGGSARRTAHEIKNLQATAFGSAEHATRTQHYLDMLSGMRVAGAGAAAGGGGVAVATPSAMVASPASGGSSSAAGGSGGAGGVTAGDRAILQVLERLYNLIANNGGLVVVTENVE